MVTGSTPGVERRFIRVSLKGNLSVVRSLSDRPVYGYISVLTPLLGNLAAVAASNHEPSSTAGPPHRIVCFFVAVVIAGERDIAVLTPLLEISLPSPLRITNQFMTGPPHHVVRLPITVVIAGNGYISVLTPLLGNLAAIAASNHEPSSTAGTPHRVVRFPIAVVVAGHGYISVFDPIAGNLAAIAASNHEPSSTAGTPHRVVRFPIAVVVPGTGISPFLTPLPKISLPSLLRITNQVPLPGCHTA